MKPHVTSNVEPHTRLEIEETRHALDLLRERSAHTCRDSLALLDRVRASCARSRATREVVALNRLQWWTWRTWSAGLDAARARARVVGERCVLVRCDACEAVCLAHRDPQAGRSAIVVSAAAVWVLPPPSVQEWLRLSQSAPDVARDVAHALCPRCCARSGSMLDAPPRRTAVDELADELMTVLVEIGDAADELLSTGSSFDQQEALTQACEAVIAGLADTVPSEELAEFAEALSELLRRLERGATADCDERHLVVGAARGAHFRPSLLRR
jgi:hypothetical protein